MCNLFRENISSHTNPVGTLAKLNQCQRTGDFNKISRTPDGQPRACRAKGGATYKHCYSKDIRLSNSLVVRMLLIHHCDLLMG